MNIIVEMRNVYGNQTVYPICDKAKLLASLTGCKTLTHRALQDIKALGYTITVKQLEPKL